MMRSLFFKMPSKIRLTQNKLLTDLKIRRFSEQKPEKLAKEETEIKENKEVEQRQTYKYDSARFEEINSKSFLDKLEKMEKAGKRPSRTLENWAFPVFLSLTSLFLYHLWTTCPYAVIYKHATISEYITKKHYYHAIFLGSLSFQTIGHFIVYYPIMLYSFVLLSKFFKQKHYIALFLTNSLLTTAATFYFGKDDTRRVNLLTPKANGAVTPLAFMSAFLMLNPTHYMFKSKMLPFFIIPFLLYSYEYNEYQTAHVNEISRAAHFTAISYGLLFGLGFRLLVLKGR